MAAAADDDEEEDEEDDDDDAANAVASADNDAAAAAGDDGEGKRGTSTRSSFPTRNVAHSDSNSALTRTADARLTAGSRSFCTIIWTNSLPRSAFLRLFRSTFAPALERLPVAPRAGSCGVRAWPVDPCALLDAAAHGGEHAA
eukprot:503720-Rhodomonas_salina.1